MAYTQTDLDNLEAAMASDSLTVEIEGRRVTYRSPTDLRIAIDYVRGQLGAGSLTPFDTQSFASFSRD